MKLNWQGHGQKHYDFKGGYLRLEWQTISGEMVYSLKSYRTSGMNVLLVLRVPDFLWQDTEPRFFNRQ